MHSELVYALHFIQQHFTRRTRFGNNYDFIASYVSLANALFLLFFYFIAVTRVCCSFTVETSFKKVRTTTNTNYCDSAYVRAYVLLVRRS